MNSPMINRRANNSGNDRSADTGEVRGDTNSQHASSLPAALVMFCTQVEADAWGAQAFYPGARASTDGEAIDNAGCPVSPSETISPELADAIAKHLDEIMGAVHELAAALLDDLGDLRDALCLVLLHEADAIGSIQ